MGQLAASPAPSGNTAKPALYKGTTCSATCFKGAATCSGGLESTATRPRGTDCSATCRKGRQSAAPPPAAPAPWGDRLQHAAHSHLLSWSKVSTASALFVLCPPQRTDHAASCTTLRHSGLAALTCSSGASARTCCRMAGSVLMARLHSVLASLAASTSLLPPAPAAGLPSSSWTTRRQEGVDDCRSAEW